MSFLIQGKTNWKFVTLVIILTVMVSVGILFYIKTNEIPSVKVYKAEKREKIQNETVNWENYQNSKMGFSIKYPSHWEKFMDGPLSWFNPESENKGFLVSFHYEDENQFFSMTEIMRISLNPKDLEELEKFEGESMLEKLVLQYKQEVLKDNPELEGMEMEKEKQILVDNVPFIQFRFSSPVAEKVDPFELSEAVHLIGVVEGDVFLISCGSASKECSSTFNLMLSTFKFIEKKEMPFLGVNHISIVFLSDEEKIKIGLPKTLNYGALVLSENLAKELGISYKGDHPGGIIPNSPADKTGIKSGDVILKVNDEDVVRLERILYNYVAGDAVDLKILRDGEEITFTVKLEEYPSNIDY